MAAKPTQSTKQAGHDWLLSCSAQQDDVQRRWADEQLAPFRTGARWRAAEAPLLESVRAMKRMGWKGVGPVLADVEANLAWWLLPTTVDTELDDARTLTLRPAGWVLRCPPVLYPVDVRTWLERPDGSGQLTDPTLLGAAFGPGGARFSMEVSR